MWARAQIISNRFNNNLAIQVHMYNGGGWLRGDSGPNSSLALIVGLNRDTLETRDAKRGQASLSKVRTQSTNHNRRSKECVSN